VFIFFSITFASLAAPGSLSLEMLNFTFLKNNSGVLISFAPSVERVEFYSINVSGEQFSFNISEIDSSLQFQVFLKYVKSFQNVIVSLFAKFIRFVWHLKRIFKELPTQYLRNKITLSFKII